jgi:hypothetical protein
VRTRQVLIPAALAVALGLAACGSSSKSSTSKANTSAPLVASTSTTSSTTTKAKAKHKRAAAKPHHASPKSTPAAKPHTTTTQSKSSTTTHTSTTTTHHKPAAPVFTRPLHATLVGQNHDPTANKKWAYTVTALDAKGRPLSGKVDTAFAFQGTVVGHETPPVHSLKDGHLHDVITFPPRAVGEPISVQVVIHTSIGSMTLDWPVKVKKK